MTTLTTESRRIHRTVGRRAKRVGLVGLHGGSAVLAQLVEYGPEPPVADGADELGQLALEVGDAVEGEAAHTLALGGAVHEDRSTVLGISFESHQAPALEVAEPLADGLLGDPGAGRQGGGTAAVRTDEVEEPTLRPSEAKVGLLGAAFEALADLSLESREGGEHVVGRGLFAAIVNHVDNLVNLGYQCRMPTPPAAAGVEGAYDPEVLRTVVRALTERSDAEVASFDRHSLLPRIDSLTTAAIDRLSGRLDDGTAWSVVVKVVRPASESAAFEVVPDELRSMVLGALDWLVEPRVYRSGLADALPEGFRMPRCHAIDEATGHIALWMEDVADHGVWDEDRYRRTARCLGRMAGRWNGARARTELGMEGRDLGTLFYGRVSHLDLPAMAEDAFWDQPALGAVVDRELREDLLRLAELTPALLARLDQLPHGLAHGDAATANFLEPGDGTVVGIDWGFCHVGPLGSDLGQLLASRVESGAIGADAIEAISSAIFTGYEEGLELEGFEPDRQLLELAFAVHLAVRSVFSALLVDGAGDSDEHRTLLCDRAGLARFGLDLAFAHASLSA
jgi:hypothetical protein